MQGDIRDACSICGLGSSLRGGHSSPLQYSCLENPTDRGAWWAAVHGVTESQAWWTFPLSCPRVPADWGIIFSLVTAHLVDVPELLCSLGGCTRLQYPAERAPFPCCLSCPGQDCSLLLTGHCSFSVSGSGDFVLCLAVYDMSCFILIIIKIIFIIVNNLKDFS